MSSNFRSVMARTKQPQKQRSQTPLQNQKSNSNSNRNSKSLMKSTVVGTQTNIHQTPIQNIITYNPNNRYFILGRGNNHQLIKKVLQTRPIWVEVNPNEGGGTFCHFKWLQNSTNFKFNNLGKEVICFNHFQFHRELTNKQRLLQNMLNFCEANKMNAYNYIPVTYVLDLNTGEEDLALHAFLKFYNRNIPQRYSGPRIHSIFLPRDRFRYQAYLSAQQLNKRSQGYFYCKPQCTKTMFSNSESTSPTKQKKQKLPNNVNYLWVLKPTFLNRGRGVVVFNDLKEFQRLIWKYYDGQGLEDYDQKLVVGKKKPEKFVVKIDEQNQQKEIIQEQTQRNIPNKMSQSKKIDIVQNSSSTVKNLELVQIQKQCDIKKEENTEQNLPTLNNIKHQSDMTQSLPVQDSQNNTTNIGVKPRLMSFIIQKYIQRPMLINGYKFDIRVWALLTQNLQVYYFRQGYLRFSSKPYTTQGKQFDPFIHLTNNSVQKYSEGYDSANGNQMNFNNFAKQFPSQGQYNKVIDKIKEIIWLSMCSVRRKINWNSRRQCFELFGYDFMVDQNYKVWLIQINTNPAIQQASPILKTLLPRMIDDMFKLTIDVIFSKPKKNQKIEASKLHKVEEQEQFQVPGYDSQENIWELLGDLKQGIQDKGTGKRLTFVKR